MKKKWKKYGAVWISLILVACMTCAAVMCSTLWERNPDAGMSKVSFSSAGTGMNDQSMIEKANSLYLDQTKKNMTTDGREVCRKGIARFITHCVPEANYATTPDAIAYVVDTGLYVDQIDQFKVEGKLPSYYEYRPLSKYPKTGQAQLQKLIDSGVDLSPVFDPEWYHSHIAAAWTAPAEMYRDDFVKKLVSGVQGCATFDVDAYKEYNPDLYAAYGNDNHAYVVHYLTKGKDEGRVCVYPKEMYKGCFNGNFD